MKHNLCLTRTTKGFRSYSEKRISLFYGCSLLPVRVLGSLAAGIKYLIDFIFKGPGSKWNHYMTVPWKTPSWRQITLTVQHNIFLVSPNSFTSVVPKVWGAPPGGGGAGRKRCVEKKNWMEFAFSNFQSTLFAICLSPGSYYEFHHTMNLF
jgi:hypothetical protein